MSKSNFIRVGKTIETYDYLEGVTIDTVNIQNGEITMVISAPLDRQEPMAFGRLMNLVSEEHESSIRFTTKAD